MPAAPPVPDLLARFFAHDPAAGRLVETRIAVPLTALIRRHLAGRLAHRLDPEDVCQSAFGSFCRRYAAGELTADDWPRLWALLSAIAVRKCQRQFERHLAGRRDVRRDLPTVAPETPAADPDPADAAVAQDILDVLLAGFDPDERLALLLYLQGHTYDEIAGEVGCAARTVRRLIGRARDKLAGPGVLT